MNALLSNKKTYYFNYRIFRNGQTQYFQCQLVKPGRERNEFVIGFKNIDEEKQQELAQQRKVEEALAAIEKINAALQEESAVSGALSQEYHSLFKIDALTGKMSLYRTDAIGMNPVLLKKLMEKGDYAAVLDKYIDTFVVPEDRERLRASSKLQVMLEQVPDVGLYKQGYRRIMNGVISYYEMNVVKTVNEAGTVTFVLGMRDVDEEMRRQIKQTREMEAQREIIEGLGSEYYSVLLVDPETDMVTTYRAEEEEGRAVAEYFRRHNNCWSKGLHSYAEEHVSELSRREFEEKLSLSYIRADGKDYSLIYEKVTDNGIIYLLVRVAFVHDKNGALAVVVGTRNVDDLIKKERQQEMALQEAYDAAEAANRAKTDFLSNMSHDIRTPMNGIIGMTAIAVSHLDEKERVRDSLQKITQASKHLLSLINEILDMSKIESGKVDLLEEEFNLSDLIDNLLAMTSSQIEEHHHALSVNISGVTHEAVIGDSLRIQKVFMNLMSNAVKYTPDGGSIQLSITEKPSNQAKVGCFEFVFEDNGIGMKEEFLEKIFDPFTRTEDGRVGKIQGTGLGMTISRNIVRMMGGDIKVDSKPGVGSRFTVTMYLKLQDKEDLHYDRFVNLDVLVADDDELSLESCCGMLNDFGMKAVGADVPIIIISAYDWSDIEQEARAAGANAFISKPLFRSRLARTFSSLVGEEEKYEQDEPLVELGNMHLSHYRALLVEDNELNAEIATEILEMTGITVELAADGTEAVDRMSECPDGKAKTEEKKGIYMKILVVDDEKEIADLVEIYLCNEGFDVRKFYRAEGVLDCIRTEQINLAILDVMLPDMDGFELLRRIRENYFFPIIMLTAKIQDMDKLTGLTLGADDYMTKPFNPLELIARVKTQIRRSVKYNPKVLKSEGNISDEIVIRGLTIDKTSHKCVLNGSELNLTPIEFSILLYLCERKGKVVSSEELFEHVWGEKYMDSNNTVMAHIARLRGKMKESSRHPKYVKTVWGVGYTVE